MITTDPLGEQKAFAARSFCWMATTVSMATNVSSAVIASSKTMYLAHAGMPRIT
jgi:hypothetical protein